MFTIDKDEASVHSDRSIDRRSVYSAENAQDPNQLQRFSDSEDEASFIESQSSRRSSHSRTHHQSSEHRRSSSSSVLTERAIQNRENRRHQQHQDTMAPGKNRKQQQKSGGTRKSTRLNLHSDDDADNPIESAVIAQMQQENKLKEAQHKALLENLKAQIAELQGKRSKKSRGTRAIPVNKEMKTAFYDVAKTELWRNTKFIADDEELRDATMLVASKIPDLKKYFATEDPDERDEIADAFLENYGGTVAKAINDSRSNAQGAIKKAYEKRVLSGESVPDAPLVLDLALRRGLEYDEKEPQKNALRRELFEWYWDSSLVGVCGSKRWGYSIRNYGLISSYTPVDSKNKYVTSSDEALIVVLFENCARRFPYVAQCKHDGKEVDKTNKEYESRYSDDTCGQDKFGGWNLEGRKRYNVIRKAISKNRKKRAAEIKTIERRTLKSLQHKYNLDQSKSQKRKNREPKDYEGKKEAKVACVGLESGDEGDEDDDASVEVAAFDMNFPARKKTRAERAEARDNEEEEEDNNEEEEEKADADSEE